MADEAPTFLIEDARIIFKNFAGKEGQYNREGDRNFGLVLDPDTAAQLLADGWNVKYLEAREEGEEDVPWISVSVSYKAKPPRVTTLSSVGRTHLDEEAIAVLDYADIATIDLVVRGYLWEVNGKQGTKAYLKTMFVTLSEDELEKKYAIKGD